MHLWIILQRTMYDLAWLKCCHFAHETHRLSEKKQKTGRQIHCWFPSTIFLFGVFLFALSQERKHNEADLDLNLHGFQLKHVMRFFFLCHMQGHGISLLWWSPTISSKKKLRLAISDQVRDLGDEAAQNGRALNFKLHERNHTKDASCVDFFETRTVSPFGYKT